MRAGELRQRIEIQQPTGVRNTLGELVDTFATIATVWAAVEPLSGSRYFQARQANSEVQGVVRIRYRAGMEPTMRLKFGTRILQIISIINPTEKNEELQILYKEALD